MLRMLLDIPQVGEPEPSWDDGAAQSAAAVEHRHRVEREREIACYLLMVPLPAARQHTPCRAAHSLWAALHLHLQAMQSRVQFADWYVIEVPRMRAGCVRCVAPGAGRGRGGARAVSPGALGPVPGALKHGVVAVA